tara:strand:+ start:544 stop:1212 length:669 start_codon:yes stop_codon:yes gene_type:complete
MTNDNHSKALNELEEFYSYVEEFYGTNDPMYPLTKEDGSGLKSQDIIAATLKYLELITQLKLECFTWGEGDSVDRERVRDILIKDFGYIEGQLAKTVPLIHEFTYCKPRFSLVAKHSKANFPSTHSVIEKMVELKGKGADASDLDGFIYDAISEWDDEFDGNPLWYDEEETDGKDELREGVLAVMEGLDINIDDLKEVFDIHSAIRSYCLQGSNGFDIGEAK